MTAIELLSCKWLIGLRIILGKAWAGAMPGLLKLELKMLNDGKIAGT